MGKLGISERIMVKVKGQGFFGGLGGLVAGTQSTTAPFMSAGYSAVLIKRYDNAILQLGYFIGNLE